MDALDLDGFPPLEEWSEFDWQEAIRITRYDRALEAHRPGDPDPRLHLIDLRLLDLDKFPPLEEWSEDHWDEAMLITRTHLISQGIRNGTVRTRPWEEVRAELDLDD